MSTSHINDIMKEFAKFNNLGVNRVAKKGGLPKSKAIKRIPKKRNVSIKALRSGKYTVMKTKDVKKAVAELYRDLNREFNVDLIASSGKKEENKHSLVSFNEDIFETQVEFNDKKSTQIEACSEFMLNICKINEVLLGSANAGLDASVKLKNYIAYIVYQLGRLFIYISRIPRFGTIFLIYVFIMISRTQAGFFLLKLIASSAYELGKMCFHQMGWDVALSNLWHDITSRVTELIETSVKSAILLLSSSLFVRETFTQLFKTKTEEMFQEFMIKGGNKLIMDTVEMHVANVIPQLQHETHEYAKYMITNGIKQQAAAVAQNAFAQTIIKSTTAFAGNLLGAYMGVPAIADTAQALLLTNA